MLNLDVYTAKEVKLLSLSIDHTNATVGDLKRQISRETKIPSNRLALRLDLSGDNLYEDLPLTVLGNCVKKVYISDLGFEINRKTSLLIEYMGSILIYAAIFFWPDCFYDKKLLIKTALQDRRYIILPLVLWSSYFAKRILETLFVHRFSHKMKSLIMMLKDCVYYWGFASLIAYYVNHPLYKPEPYESRFIGTLLFTFCQVGNLSAHYALRNLRPPGTEIRSIPFPNCNVFTYLFNYVSCPNYTYEFGTWLGFSLVVNCFYTSFFMFFGFYKMTVSAFKKHRRYIAEFSDYPKSRKLIVPFLV